MQKRFVRAATFVAAVTLDLLFVQTTGIPSVTDWPQQPVAGGAFAAAIAAQEAHTDDLLRQPGVVGTAVSIGPAGTPTIKVYVTPSGFVKLPTRLDGHPVLVEVTGPFYALGSVPEGALRTNEEEMDPKRSFPRPVPIGVSTGQVDVTAGTIAARVSSGADVFALSNNHVYANRNRANLGDLILQPGSIDGGANPGDAIGTLHDFEPIKFCSPFPICPDNRIDAAIAATTSEDLGNSTPDNGYGTPRSETLAPRLGLEVQKYGRTTGHTRGRITGINATINVGFRDGSARFVGQIVISGNGFSAPGDSGSLIVSDGDEKDARRPVGLLFAGSQSTTLANPIDPVLKRFDVTIDGS